MGWSGFHDGCPLHGHATDEIKSLDLGIGCICRVLTDNPEPFVERMVTKIAELEQDIAELKFKLRAKTYTVESVMAEPERIKCPNCYAGWRDLVYGIGQSKCRTCEGMGTLSHQQILSLVERLRIQLDERDARLAELEKRPTHEGVVQWHKELADAICNESTSPENALAIEEAAQRYRAEFMEPTDAD